MKKSTKIILACAVLLILSLMIVAAVTKGAEGTVVCPECKGAGTVEGLPCETCGGEKEVTGTWWALVPPFIAIGLALITKEVYSSSSESFRAVCLPEDSLLSAP